MTDDELKRVCGGFTFDKAKGDGCTLAADGWWRDACDAHDVEYGAGGPDRAGADRRLRDNMMAHDAPPIIAKAYQLGVRIGGSPLFKTPWRWGFGRDIDAKK